MVQHDTANQKLCKPVKLSEISKPSIPKIIKSGNEKILLVFREDFVILALLYIWHVYVL
jgi:hypothetical protein